MKPILLPLALFALLIGGSGSARATPLAALLDDGMEALHKASPPPVGSMGALLLDAPSTLADETSVADSLSRAAARWPGVAWVSPFALSRAARDAGIDADRLGGSPDTTARFMASLGVDRLVVIKLTLERQETLADFSLYAPTGERLRLYQTLTRLDAPLLAAPRIVVGIGAPVSPAEGEAMGPSLTVDGLVGGLASYRAGDGAVRLFVGVGNRLALYRFDGATLSPLGETPLDEPEEVVGLFYREGELFVSSLVGALVRSRIYRVADDGGLAPLAEGIEWLLIAGGDGLLYGREQLPDRSLAPRIVRLERHEGRVTATPFVALAEGASLSGVALVDLTGDGLPDPVAIDDRQSLVGPIGADLSFGKIGESYGGSPLSVPLRHGGEGTDLFELSAAPVVMADPIRLAVARNIRSSAFIPSAGYATGRVALLARRGDAWNVVRESPALEGPVTALTLLPDGRLLAARHRFAPFGAGSSTLECLTLIAP
ncbi:MAG: hypothetical protein HQK87_00585 [Nitrospinae bacterium]|nr:hypothetical protein [Nitrospinota bacterium]